VAERIVVVGWPAPVPLPAAGLYVGGRRHLAAVTPGARTVPIGGDLEPALTAIEAEPGRVCVLASGDPGFFGIVRALAARFGPDALEVHPGVSSVSLAFARLGLPWDDAVVVSAHGRPLGEAARVAAGSAKTAVLVSPDAPPEALGKELLNLMVTASVVVASRLGLDGESVNRTDVAGLAAGTWDPLSVVVVLRDHPIPVSAGLAWGRPHGAFAHRAGMVTKAEVRAAALGKLELPATGVLWDVGAGSGSVGIEAVLLCPGLGVFAVERRPDDAGRIEANAIGLGATVTVIRGAAPAALDGLPAPDRVFVGGGGLAVIDHVLRALRPGGRVVATYAAIDRAAAAADRLGNLVQLAVNRGERLPDGGWRLVPDNPVFIVWGPDR
jgi:precorrin-6B C5,15-methyltransferase / cobalt-precorrin-6B C5,C15-methyltransferase